MTAAELVRSVRLRRGLTQAQLATRAGTTQTAISRLEHGQRSPSVETVRQLLLVMGDELGLTARPLRGRHDPAHLQAELRLTPAERLERAFAWMRLNADLGAGGVARACVEPRRLRRA